MRIDFFGDEVERIVEIDELTGEVLAERTEVNLYPATHYVTPREKLLVAIDKIEDEMEERVRWLERPGPRPRGGAAEAADPVRPRDDARGRLLLRDRELLAPSRRPRGGRAAVDADRLLPDRLPAGRRREPHHDPAGPRHVQERPDPQGDPRRLRLPAAIGPRQPAADIRGVRGPHEPGRLHERDAGSVRDRARRPRRGAVHPSDRRRRPADQRAPDRRARSTTCWPRSARPSSAASASSSRP